MFMPLQEAGSSHALSLPLLAFMHQVTRSKTRAYPKRGGGCAISSPRSVGVAPLQNPAAPKRPQKNAPNQTTPSAGRKSDQNASGH